MGKKIVIRSAELEADEDRARIADLSRRANAQARDPISGRFISWDVVSAQVCDDDPADDPSRANFISIEENDIDPYDDGDSIIDDETDDDGLIDPSTPWAYCVKCGEPLYARGLKLCSKCELDRLVQVEEMRTRMEATERKRAKQAPAPVAVSAPTASYFSGQTGHDRAPTTKESLAEALAEDDEEGVIRLAKELIAEKDKEENGKSCRRGPHGSCCSHVGDRTNPRTGVPLRHTQNYRPKYRALRQLHR